jgi:hypothetical protein
MLTTDDLSESLDGSLLAARTTTTQGAEPGKYSEDRLLRLLTVHDTEPVLLERITRARALFAADRHEARCAMNKSAETLHFDLL